MVARTGIFMSALVAALFAPQPALANEPLAAAASPAPAPYKPGLDEKFSAMAGLTQWVILRGGNLALEYKLGRLALEVSHGQGLDFNQLGGLALSSAERDAGARVRVPWTTGFGVGYRISENLHVLLELKAHRYEVSSRDPSSRASYTTFSIGPGVFYAIYLYKGLFLEPNVRFWPTVASTLTRDRVTLRQPDGTSYEHHAHDLGVFANMNLGYTF